MLRRFDEGSNAQYRDTYENHPEHQPRSDLHMAHLADQIGEYRLKCDDIMNEVTDAGGESTKIPKLQQALQKFDENFDVIGPVNFNWGQARVKSPSSDDRYIRERFIPQSKSPIIKNEYALRYLAGQERMCRTSGMARRLTLQLLNLRSRDQATHRVFKVALQAWPTLVGMKSLIEYTTEYKVGDTYFRADRFCRYKHESIAERRAIRQRALYGASGSNDGQVFLCLNQEKTKGQQLKGKIVS